MREGGRGGGGQSEGVGDGEGEGEREGAGVKKGELVFRACWAASAQAGSAKGITILMMFHRTNHVPYLCETGTRESGGGWGRGFYRPIKEGEDSSFHTVQHKRQMCKALAFFVVGCCL